MFGNIITFDLNLKYFNSIQRTAQKLQFALFDNIIYGIKVPYLCKLCNYIDHFRELVILLSRKFHCHIIGLSKVTGCSVLNYFKQIFVATSSNPQLLWNSLGLCYKLVWRYHNYFPKSHICSTSCIEIHISFAIFNNKESRNCKVRSTLSIPKGIDDG